MADLCIECDKVVVGRQHAVSLDVCDRWQHRLCGTATCVPPATVLFRPCPSKLEEIDLLNNAVHRAESDRTRVLVKRKQQHIEMILESKNIAFERIDISTDEAQKAEMREKAGDPKALPPQIVSGDRYCGDHDAFDLAVENEALDEFLKP